MSYVHTRIASLCGPLQIQDGPCITIMIGTALLHNICSLQILNQLQTHEDMHDKIRNLTRKHIRQGIHHPWAVNSITIFRNKNTRLICTWLVPWSSSPGASCDSPQQKRQLFLDQKSADGPDSIELQQHLEVPKTARIQILVAACIYSRNYNHSSSRVE